MKNSLTLPNLANRNIISLTYGNDEPICTYNDGYMRYFVMQSVKSDKDSAFNQYYKPIFSDEVFNFFSKDLDINGNICEL